MKICGFVNATYCAEISFARIYQVLNVNKLDEQELQKQLKDFFQNALYQ